LVPIPNGRGRHRAAPFGVGPWDGARVASQQSPTLRPGQGHYSRRAGAVEPDGTPRSQEGAGFGPVVRSEPPCGGLRSLPFGPTRVGPWMRRPGRARAQARRHVALDGVALTARNSHQIRPHLPGPFPGRAAHGSRGRYLAKECVGSNRACKERLQLPAAKRRQPRRIPKKRRRRVRRIHCGQRTGRTRGLRPALPLRKNPEGSRFPLTNSFRNGPTLRGRSRRCQVLETAPPGG